MKLIMTKRYTIFFLFLILFSMSGFVSAQENKNQVPFPMNWEEFPGGKINLSYLLEKPAGKDGFIRIENGHFVKPDGERFRIWGVNFTGGAAYPEKSVASKTAEFLAAMGINAVRFHFLDSDWGAEKTIFQSDTNIPSC